MHFMIFNQVFGIFENFGVFQNQRGFCKIFGMGFEYLILKTSYIASHEHYNYIFMHLDVCYICYLIVCW